MGVQGLISIICTRNILVLVYLEYILLVVEYLLLFNSTTSVNVRSGVKQGNPFSSYFTL